MPDRSAWSWWPVEFIRSTLNSPVLGRDAAPLSTLLAAGVVAVGMLMMIPGRICACGGGHASQARLVAARTDMKNLETALDQFRADVGRYPMTAEGLVALRQAPAQSSNWHGPYIRAEEQPLIDPWEQLYVYRSPGEHNATSFDLTSCGPDRRLGTSDDIVNWKQ